MMKRVIGKGQRLMVMGLLILLITQVPAFPADTNVGLGDILKKTEQSYQRIQAFTALFRQRTTSAAGTGMGTSAEGKLYFQKPRQMRWEYEKPDPQVFVASQYIAWLYVPAEKQTSLIEAKTFFSTPLARALFDGATELRNHFEITMDPAQSSKTTAVLKLIPKGEDPNIKILFLWIDLETYRILMIETHDALGNTNHITLEAQKAVTFLDPKLFQMDFPASTAVVDSDGRELSKEEILRLKSRLNL